MGSTSGGCTSATPWATPCLHPPQTTGEALAARHAANGWMHKVRHIVPCVLQLPHLTAIAGEAAARRLPGARQS